MPQRLSDVLAQQPRRLSDVMSETQWPAGREPTRPVMEEPVMGAGGVGLAEGVQEVLPKVFGRDLLTPEVLQRQVEGPGKKALEFHDKTGMGFDDILGAYAEVPKTPDQLKRWEDDLVRRQYSNIIAETAYAIGRGTLKTAAGLGPGTIAWGQRTLASALRYGPFAGTEWVQRTVADLDLEAYSFDEPVQKLYDIANNPMVGPGKGGGTKAFIANAVGETFPLMAMSTVAALATGGTSLGPSVGPFLTAAFAERESIYRQALAGGASQEQALLEGTVGGTVNGVIEIMQVSKILRLGKGAGDGVLKEFATAVRERSMKKIAAKGAALTARQTTDAIQEGLEEVAQEWVGQGLAIAVHGAQVPTLKEGATLSGQAFVGGASAGFILGLGNLVLEGSTQTRESAQEPAKTAVEVVEKPAMVMTPDELTQYESKLTDAEAQDAEEKTAQGKPAEAAPAVEPTGPPEGPAAVAGGVQETPQAEAPVAPTPAGGKMPLTEMTQADVFPGWEAATKWFASRGNPHQIDKQALGQWASTLPTPEEAAAGTANHQLQFMADAMYKWWGANQDGLKEIPTPYGYSLYDWLRKAAYVSRWPTESSTDVKPVSVLSPSRITNKALAKMGQAAPETIGPKGKPAGTAAASEGMEGGAPAVPPSIIPPEIAAQADGGPLPDFGTRNAVTEEVRRILGLDGIPSPQKQSQAQWLTEAIEQGYADPQRALDLAGQIIANPRVLSEHEDMGIKYAGAKLYLESRQLGREARQTTDEAATRDIEARRKIVDDKIEVLTRAVELAGTEWGRAGVSRQVDMDDDGNLQNNIRRIEATSGKQMSAKDKAKLQQLTDELVDLREKLRQAESKQAEKTARKTVKSGSGPQSRYTKMTASQKDAELLSLKGELIELLKAGC